MTDLADLRLLAVSWALRKAKSQSILIMLRGKIALRDGPLEILLGGEWGRAKYKKIFSQGKIKWKKNSCTPINPKKYSCYGLKFSYKEFDNEKKFMPLENSPPPNQWSVPKLTWSKKESVVYEALFYLK